VRNGGTLTKQGTGRS